MMIKALLDANFVHAYARWIHKQEKTKKKFASHLARACVVYILELFREAILVFDGIVGYCQIG
jgi:hypothetical protein